MLRVHPRGSGVVKWYSVCLGFFSDEEAGSFMLINC
jgi:hypothetical protein